MTDGSGLDSAALRYRRAGRLHRGFVRGKLRSDPVYAAIVRGDFLPESGTLVDLGCGRGILLAALRESGRPLALVGIDRSDSAEVARKALGEDAGILRADLRDCEIPECEAATIVDVLHYLEPAAQESLVRRVVAALRPGGVLVVREADAGAGGGSWAVRIAERLRAVMRGTPFQTLSYRTKEGWGELLRGSGLDVSIRPMGEGTPFANVLLVGVKPGGAARSPRRIESPPWRSPGSSP